MNNILITTGDIKEDYEIIDAIFSFDSCQESLFSGADPNKAFVSIFSNWNDLSKKKSK